MRQPSFSRRLDPANNNNTASKDPNGGLVRDQQDARVGKGGQRSLGLSPDRVGRRGAFAAFLGALSEPSRRGLGAGQAYCGCGVSVPWGFPALHRCTAGWMDHSRSTVRGAFHNGSCGGAWRGTGRGGAGVGTNVRKQPMVACSLNDSTPRLLVAQPATHILRPETPKESRHVALA